MPTSQPQAISPDNFYIKARQTQGTGDLKTAREMYEALLKHIPSHADAMTMLASIEYQEGNDVQAEAYVDRAIDLYLSVVNRDPSQAVARAGAINLMLSRDRVREAVQASEALNVQINPIRSDPITFDARRQDARKKGLPTMIFNTIPKSASESIWNQVADGLGMAQCHLSIGVFPNVVMLPGRLRIAADGGIIDKEHIAATDFNIARLKAAGIDRVGFQMRDPRQATLSWAHFVKDDVSMRLLGPIWRQIVPSADVLKGPFEGLVDWCIAHYLPRLVDFMMGWWTLAGDESAPIKVGVFSFEKFRTEPEAYFDEFLGFYGIDKALFDADRAAKADVVHLRVGGTSEWRDILTPAQRDRAWKALPKELTDAYGWTR